MVALAQHRPLSGVLFATYPSTLARYAEQFLGRLVEQERRAVWVAYDQWIRGLRQKGLVKRARLPRDDRLPALVTRLARSYRLYGQSPALQTALQQDARLRFGTPPPMRTSTTC